MKNKGAILLSDAHSEEVALAKVFEVFLSFCGKDTRNGFTDFLYTYLKDARVETFRDDNEVRLGEKIGPELLKAIRESKISIPVFSKHYAFSKWCLIELAEMVNCHKNGGHVIYPIFYNVAPFEVRHQDGRYKKAFQEHEKKFNKETVEKWREALSIVGELKGLELKKATNGKEGKLVKRVVEKVLLDLKKNYTALPENLVGIDTHLEKLKELLHFDFGGARVVVIHGMGGLGKTSIAKVAFNQFHDRFDNHCFLDDVRQKLEHRNGIVKLQNQLISKIKNRKFSKRIFDANEGRDTIKGTVCGRKVILVLDNVDHISQVKMLMGNIGWYGAQSRIIITTRDTDVLRAIERTCQIEGLNNVCTGYKPKYMEDHDCLQLFSKYAFMRDCPAEGYERLSAEVIAIAAGLPLVLVVMGSTLFTVEGKDLWNEKLRKLREMPHKEVIDKLRFSYDALEDTERQIFLDIACLFIGEEVTMPSYMWDDCSFYPRDGINMLVRMSLITVNEDNVLVMHDQLRDLGRHIVRNESLYKLGKQSRLWRTEQAMEILETNQGTASVNALCLPVSETESPVLASSFNNIPNIRYLDMGCKYLVGDFKDLLLGLRWLTILNFREGSPTNLHLKQLVILNLARNDFIEDLRDFKIGKKLKVLVLSDCPSVRVLNLSKHPSLEILILSDCASLCAIDGLEKLKSLKWLKASGCPALEKVCLPDLTNLRTLDIIDCECLEMFPDFSNLKMLENIRLRGCSKLIEIKGLEKLELLEDLCLDNCSSLERLPDFSNLKNLESINANGCTSLVEIKGLDKLESLRFLQLRECRSLSGTINMSNLDKFYSFHVPTLELTNFDFLKKLKELKITLEDNLLMFKGFNVNDQYISGESMIRLLIDEIQDLSWLESLVKMDINYCSHFKRVLNLPNFGTLKSIKLRSCDDLDDVEGIGVIESLESLVIIRCYKIRQIPDLRKLKTLKRLYLGDLNLISIHGLDELKSLESLYTRRCQLIETLPDLSNLVKLAVLTVSGCARLTEIRGLEKLESLRFLNIRECKSIVTLPDVSNLKKLIKLDASGCVRLSKITGLEELASLEWLNIDGCESIEALPDLPNTYVQRTYEDTEDLGSSYETSEISTDSMTDVSTDLMTDVEDHDPLACLIESEDWGSDYEHEILETSIDYDPPTCLMDPLNSVYEHGETSSSMPEMRENVSQTWLEDTVDLGLSSMAGIEDHEWLAWLGADPLNSVYEQGESSSSMPEMKDR